MKDYNWNFTLTESFWETLKEVNKIQLSTSVLAISQALKDVVPNYNPDGIKSAMSEIVATQKVWREAVLPLRSVLEMIASAYPTLKMDSTAMAQSILSQVDTSTLRALRESVSLAVLAKADWSWLSEVHTEETTDDEHNAASNFDLESSVTQEVRAEMAADINQILADPNTMHVASQSKYLQWKERNPGFAAFFLNILFPILLLIADWGFSSWQARSTKDSRVYEEPVSTSSVVYNITVENNITVIGDVPYYYEVEFINPETGELVTGYIYKGNIIAKEQDETELQEEVTEPTEVAESVPDAAVSQTEPVE